MLRHTGTKRSFRHNLRLAIFLSLSAGFVNAAGLMAFAVLTTNITGHAATFAADFSLNDMRAVKMAGLCLLLFLAGTFSRVFIPVPWAGTSDMSIRCRC